MANLRGMALMTVAMLCFAVADAAIKELSETLPVGQILVILGLAGVAMFGAACKLAGDTLWTRSYGHPAVLVRTLAEGTGSACFVIALALTPLASASAIAQSAPLMVTLGAALFLGEKVGWRRWSAILVGFAGVLIIIKPGLDGFQPASLFAVAGAMGLATRDLTSRMAPGNVTTLQLGLTGFVAVVPAGVLLLWVLGQSWVPLKISNIGGLVLASGFAGAAIYSVTAAMRVGDVAVISPFRYTRLVFALFIAVYWFGEDPDWTTWVGAAIIVASGFYTFIRQRRVAG